MFGWGRKAQVVESGNEETVDENEYSVSEAEELDLKDVAKFSRGVVFDGAVIPSDSEKGLVLRMFADLRGEGSFCDVSFLCQGVLFRAHRVLVSSWSRWLRALLTEAPDEEVVSLDIFDPEAFSMVLDYMYGTQLTVSYQNADALIKVVRRLELQLLEQQCWRYLISIIDSSNCEVLHELADRYDCPPLKLSAWRILQQTVPGYSSAPELAAEPSMNSYVIIGSGFTNPGEMPVPKDSEPTWWPSDDEDGDNIPSIFYVPDSEVESDNEEDGIVGKTDAIYESSKQVKRYTHPDQLSANASAVDVVRSWASRLQHVYDQCIPEAMFESSESEISNLKKDTARMKPPVNSNLLPIRRARKRGGEKATYDWEGELVRFYTTLNLPEKIQDIPTILKTWSNREDQMIGTLLTKYKKQIPPDLFEYLDNLQNTIESKTVASSVK